MTRFCAMVLVEADDPRLASENVPEQWEAVQDALLIGSATRLLAAISESDAGQLLLALQNFKRLTGEPLGEISDNRSIRRH